MFLHKQLWKNYGMTVYVQNTLTEPTPAAGRLFGDIVAANSQYVAVQGGNINIPQVVYVYNLSDGSLKYTINNPNVNTTDASDWFGISVAMNETYLAIGASTEDDAGGINSGKIYVYTLSNGSLSYTINNPNAFGTSANDNFGQALSMSTNYLCAGTQDEDSTGYTSSGKTYVFNVSSGSLKYTLNDPNAYSTPAGDRFGIYTSVTENYIVVSTPYETSATSGAGGKIYVFSMATGTLSYTLSCPPEYASGSFGQGGAFANSSYISTGIYGSDVVLLYDISNGNLIRTFTNPNMFGSIYNDNFGQETMIYGSYILISATNESDINGNRYSGVIYIFNIDGSFVTVISNPDLPGTDTYFGTDPYMTSTGYIVAGAYSANVGSIVNAGKAYIFKIL